MCLTSPTPAPTSAAPARSRSAAHDGRYDIRGTKIFISGGDHDMTENIVHMVLARTPTRRPGRRDCRCSSSQVRPDGTPNDVAVTGIEHKMGIKASSTAQLAFGDNNACIGELVGTVENRGMPQMFHLMNFARIGVGIQSLALASSAYLNALEYAKDRKQARRSSSGRTPPAPRVPIIEHPDVRRMLLDMKSRVEGIRGARGQAHDAHRSRPRDRQDRRRQDRAEYHQGQVDLLCR
jgi:alkylation response protein AidB-like acyl-CoA dehydrogenase